MSTDRLESPPNNTSLRAAENEQERRCTRCHQWLPIAQFRFALRRVGKRHTKCTACEVELERARRIRRRSKRIYEDFLAESRRKYTATALAALCEEMIARYGGVSNFARRWHEATEYAGSSRRTATTLRSYMVLLRVMAAREELLPKVPELTDDELAERKERSLIRLIQEQPALAIRACRELGWRVVPANYEEPAAPAGESAGYELD